MKFTQILARALAPIAGKAPLTVHALEDSGEVEVFVYDQIGYWGIQAEDFAREIMAIDADVIHLRIDSPGGDVFMARAMKTALEQHRAKVIAHVDGLAASAASFLMMGADEIEITKGAFVMIHNAWTITMDDHRGHAKSRDLLMKIDASIRADYAKKSGKSPDDFATLMDDETWLDADEALALGIVDRVFDKGEAPENRFDLSIFDKAPAALAAPPKPDPAAAHRAQQMRKLELLEKIAP